MIKYKEGTSFRRHHVEDKYTYYHWEGHRYRYLILDVYTIYIRTNIGSHILRELDNYGIMFMDNGNACQTKWIGIILLKMHDGTIRLSTN